MYMLVKEPTGKLSEAFGVLDDAVGQDEFSESEAVSALTQALGEDGQKVWNNLKQGDYVMEV